MLKVIEGHVGLVIAFRRVPIAPVSALLLTMQGLVCACNGFAGNDPEMSKTMSIITRMAELLDLRILIPCVWRRCRLKCAIMLKSANITAGIRTSRTTVLHPVLLCCPTYLV